MDAFLKRYAPGSYIFLGALSGYIGMAIVWALWPNRSPWEALFNTVVGLLVIGGFLLWLGRDHSNG